MSFRAEKVEELHKQSGEKSIDFAHAIFGPGSKLGPDYFRGKESISTKHLELLCQHFNVPMTFFFDNEPICQNIGNVVRNNRIGVGNVNISSNDVEQLQQVITMLHDQLREKDELITWLKNQCDMQLKTFQNMKNQ